MPVRPEMPLDWFQSTPANFTAGDDFLAAFGDERGVFQSTPANFTAGDLPPRPGAGLARAVSIHARQFHSGRLAQAIEDLPLPDVSIHARQFHSGRLQAAVQPGERDRVSIHARQFHSGRPPHAPRSGAAARCFNPRPPISQRATLLASCPHPEQEEFQSTPANFTAGDAGAGTAAADHGHVSIHARQFHSGRRPAPTAASAPASCFNPRPPISQRATCR